MALHHFVKVPLVLFFSLLWHVDSYAQGYSFSGSRSQALANASVCLEDVYGHHNNPASISGITQFTFGIAYENRFLLKELQHQSYAFALPMGKGVLSFGGNSFGYRDFRTFKNGVGYAMKLLKELSLGIQVNHHMIRLSGPYGVSQTVTGELGLSYAVSSDWSFGLAVFNLGRNKLTETPIERHTTSMRFGTVYNVSAMVRAVAEFEKDLQHPLRFKSGIEYQPDGSVFFRIGFATSPIELSAGVGWVFAERYHLDFGTQYHQVLGWSPNVSFRFALKK